MEGRLSPKWYDWWMELNTGSYQLGSNDALLALWDDRLHDTPNADPDWVRSQLLDGSRVRYHAQRGDPNLPVPSEADVNGLLGVSSGALGVVRCPHKGYHVRLYHKKKLVPRKELKVLNRLFPWTEAGDKQKTNLDVASLVYYALRAGHKKPVDEVLSVVTVGQVNSVVVALLIAALGNPMWSEVYTMLRADGRCCLTRRSYKSYFKAVSIAVRRTARWHTGRSLNVAEVAFSAYWELSIGRAANLSDPAEEVAKRCGPVLELKNPYTGVSFTPDLKRHIRLIIQQLMPDSDEFGTWIDFILQRQSWAPSGSAAGAKALVDGKYVRIKKRSYFENMPTSEPAAWLDTPPELRAHFSQKLEAGKDRAIYGTEPRDQAIVTYLIRPLERRMGRIRNFINGHEGMLEVADIAVKLGLVKDKRVECSMLDFADFNYQHTLANQKLLFDVIAEEAARYGNADLTKAAKWVAEAQLNQYFRIPLDERWHRVTQGMFSGVRSTDFTNTILNLAYFEAMRDIVFRETGLAPIELFNVHKGDDVWISNMSRLWASELYSAMARAGFVFQESKQMFDRARGEFLRVLYTSEGARGYPMRAVATLIIKPIQSIDELAPPARATALTSQIHLLYRRGISREACDVVFQATVGHALSLKGPGGGGVSIPLGVAGKSFLTGGLDLGAPMTVGVDGVASPPVPTMQTTSRSMEEQIGRNMSHDWVGVISSQVAVPFDSKMVEDSLHRANVSDSHRPEDRNRAMRQYYRDLRKWRVQINGIAGSAACVRVPLIFRQTAWHRMETVAGMLAHSLRSAVITGEEVPVLPRVMGTIASAVASSPFQSLSNAQQASKLGMIESARLCIQLSANQRKGGEAMAYLDHLREMVGEEATVMALKGIRGIGVSYEALFHPIILSLISELGTDAAIHTAKRGDVTNQYQWIRRTDMFKLQLLLFADAELGLQDWSHQ